MEGIFIPSSDCVQAFGLHTPFDNPEERPSRSAVGAWHNGNRGQASPRLYEFSALY